MKKQERELLIAKFGDKISRTRLDVQNAKEKAKFKFKATHTKINHWTDSLSRGDKEDTSLELFWKFLKSLKISIVSHL